MRASGILLPVTSLPSDYGIGAMTEEAYEWVRQLKKAGQTYWQILPIGPTGYGDSPYQPFSTFAGNPYMIDLTALVDKGYVTKEECDEICWGERDDRVDYGKIYYGKWRILRKAYERSGIGSNPDFLAFCKKEAHWLDDYAMYSEIKDHCGGVCWIEWPKELRDRDEKALAAFEREHADGVAFYKYVQYEFFKQWEALKEYAGEQGIKIIGDIPIYVSFDSADTWSGRKLFQFDEDGRPSFVAGCPPDAFCSTGQLWGNPLYDWRYHEETGFAWWLSRISHLMRMFDVVRIDHFRGFDEYYAIPFGDETAEFGHWEPGPGMKLFDKIREVLGEVPIIAEDLGYLTPSVLKMLSDSGYPGMKVLEFAFGGESDNLYLPHNHVTNSVVYTGTHDNDTLISWYRSQEDYRKGYICNYLGLKYPTDEEAAFGMIRAAQMSVADTCIIPIQDYLMLGGEARINEPSTMGGNWEWRLVKGQVTDRILERIYWISRMYRREAGHD